MSSVKEYLHDLWSEREAEIGFICPECGHPAAAYVKISDDEYEQFEDVSCLNREDPHAYVVVIRKSEGDARTYTAELEENSDVDVRIDVDDSYYDDDWDEPEPEPDAYGIFVQAMNDWHANFTELSSRSGSSSRNRMLFTTLYSILEAYLSDAIIGIAMDDENVQRALLRLDGLKDKQVSLDTVLSKPDIVKEMVKSTLQGLSFHKLGAVSGICKNALGRPLLPEAADQRAFIVASIDKRHDCVHRNGANKNGVVHKDITDEYLASLSFLFDSMAEGLNSRIRELQAERHFDDLGPEEPR